MWEFEYWLPQSPERVWTMLWKSEVLWKILQCCGRSNSLLNIRAAKMKWCEVWQMFSFQSYASRSSKNMLEEPRAGWGPAAVRACWAQQSEGISAELPSALPWCRSQPFLSVTAVIRKTFSESYCISFRISFRSSYQCLLLCKKRNWNNVLKWHQTPCRCFVLLLCSTVTGCAQTYISTCSIVHWPCLRTTGAGAQEPRQNQELMPLWALVPYMAGLEYEPAGAVCKAYL